VVIRDPLGHWRGQHHASATPNVQATQTAQAATASVVCQINVNSAIQNNSQTNELFDMDQLGLLFAQRLK
jgi:hypothetical protein